MTKDIKPQSQKILRIPTKRNKKKITPGHIIAKPAKNKVKEKILKVASEKDTITLKGVRAEQRWPVKGHDGSQRQYSKSGRKMMESL